MIPYRLINTLLNGFSAEFFYVLWCLLVWLTVYHMLFSTKPQPKKQEKTKRT